MSVKSTVETLSPTRVRLAVEVSFAELEPSLKRAYQAVAQQVNIPGFRRGRVPAAVIDQRIGRGTVLNEAVQEVIPQQLFAALQEHRVRSLGRPEVGDLEFDDGQPLRFTAEVDVRPEIELPDLAGISVTVDEVQVTQEVIAQQLGVLRDRFGTLKSVERATQTGDYVQIDLEATVDGEAIEGGTATNISHEVGSRQLLPGLDEVLVGMSAGDHTTFTTALVGGEHAGRDAEVAVSLRAVKEKELPPLEDDFAQLASEFDTLEELRGDIRQRLLQGKRFEQLYTARDRALDELLQRTEVPAPEGVVRDEVAHRKQHLNEDLEQIGQTLADYLAHEGKTEEEMDAELTESVDRTVRIQMVLDALAESEQVQVSDEEFGREVASRAQRAGMEPQKYYDQLVQAGGAASVYAEVRRGKTLGLVLERITITDSAGNRVSAEPERVPDTAA
jgi:trigger factor